MPLTDFDRTLAALTGPEQHDAHVRLLDSMVAEIRADLVALIKG